MRRNRSIPDAAVIPELGYPDVPAAARWLCDAFGFAERLRATHCVPLPDDLDELAGIYVEPVACILRAAERVPRGGFNDGNGGTVTTSRTFCDGGGAARTVDGKPTTRTVASMM